MKTLELGLEELSVQEAKEVNGGIICTALAIGALFIGSVAVGFAVGCRIWY